MSEQIGYVDTIVIGAGLTGLSCAHALLKGGVDFLLLEKAERVGGQIQTFREEGFVYERGPNTGIISTPEVAELFDDYPELLQTANEEAKRRLILKDGKFRPLPSGLKSAITTDLFAWQDKLRILAEPFRAKGADPNESIASLVRRRLGESYYRYAVDPFVGGIYAGNPERLVTRHALPRLYALEAKYGSFIRGAMAVMRRQKTERELRATKQIFSTRGGLSSLTEAIAERVREVGRLQLGCRELYAYYLPHFDKLPDELLNRLPQELRGARTVDDLNLITSHRVSDAQWLLSVIDRDGKEIFYLCKQLITTVGTEELAELLLLPDKAPLQTIQQMPYAPIVQVALGYRVAPKIDFHAFGGLVPSCECREILGILNPSACFEGRCPEGGLLLSAFLGGMRCPELIDYSDEQIRQITLDFIKRSLGTEQIPELFRIFRHRRAIPQYEADTDKRLDCIAEMEHNHHGLHIGGNMLGGIGMPDRIKQGFALAERIMTQDKQSRY